MMDEELFREAAQFVRDNPDSFRNAVLWFEGGGFDSLSDAWEMATVSCDWDKILLIVSQCVSENGKDIDTLKAYFAMFRGSYHTSKHPSHLIIENALREAKQAVQKDDWDDPAYILATEALKLADIEGNKLSRLSKLLTSGKLEIRHMRNKNRCKVHIDDWRTYIERANYFSRDPFSSEVLAAMKDEIEKRKNEIRLEKAKKTR